MNTMSTAYLAYSGAFKPIELHANESWEEAKNRLKLSSGLWANADFIFKGKVLQNEDPVSKIPHWATLSIHLRQQPQELTSPTNKKYTLNVTRYDSMKDIAKQLAEKLPGITLDRLKLVATGLRYGTLMTENSWFGEYEIRDALKRDDYYIEYTEITGKGPGRGGYIAIPLLNKVGGEISELTELNTKLAQFVQILEADQVVEGEFLVYEEHGYHRIRWVPKDTLYSTVYQIRVSQGEGSEYLTSKGWIWGEIYDKSAGSDTSKDPKPTWEARTHSLGDLFVKENVRTGKISFKKLDTVHAVTDARTNETRPVVVLFNGPDSRTPLSALKRHIAACFDDVSAEEIVSLKVGDRELVDHADVLALQEDDVIRLVSKKK